MDRKRALIALVLLLSAGLGGFGLWRVRIGQREQGVRRAFEAYQRALQEGDASGLRAVLAAGSRAEFEQGGGASALPLIKGLSPADGRVDRVEFSGADRATAHLLAASGKGEALLIRESGQWRLEKVSWQVSMDSGTAGGGQRVPGAAVPKDVRALLDRMAGPDPRDAGQAWLELGGKYIYTNQFRRDLHGAFYDPRPIPFQIYFMENQMGGRTIRAYSTKLEPLDPGSAAARTVGEALRLDMWRMEGLGLEAGSPDPTAWWPGYARQHGIEPAPAMASEAKGSSATPSSTASSSSFPFLDPKVPATGEARITFDNREETFQLGTSFWTDTRMKDPTQATLEFRTPKDDLGNPRRVRLRFNATRAGVQKTDGAAVDVVYIADGGQMFPPQGPCEIRLKTPYSGEEGSLMKGEVPLVRIHSAGIDHTLALTFEVRGSFVKRP